MRKNLKIAIHSSNFYYLMLWKNDTYRNSPGKVAIALVFFSFFIFPLEGCTSYHSFTPGALYYSRKQSAGLRYFKGL